MKTIPLAAAILSAGVFFALWLRAKRQVGVLRKNLERQANLLTGAAQQLRARLNDVLGLVQTLAMRADEFSDDNGTLIETVAGSGAAAKAVLLDVFDIIEIESAQLKFHPSVTLLSEIVEFLRRVNAPAIKAKGVRVEYDVKASARVWLAFDDMRLRQCANAMLRQAIAQCEKNVRLSISVSKIERRKHQRLITIVVADDCKGVNEELAGSYFSMGDFIRIRYIARNNSPLSLLVARLMVRKMGGDITVACVPQKGAIFRLTAPAKFARNAHEEEDVEVLTPAEVARGLISGRTVMIVEDNDVNRQVLEAFLKPLQPERILTAENGEKALSLLDGEKCDLVLMDTQMPVMNGLVATEMMRAGSQSWSQVPVIAISAGATSKERDAAFKAGSNAFLSKPVSAEDLYEKIARVCSS